MDYEGRIYRPPSEANSLILQVTVGCSHNKCTFCPMYKDKEFKLKDIGVISKDLQEARLRYKHVERVFLADGDALCMNTDLFCQLLSNVRNTFPECTRIGSYARATHINKKSCEELLLLRDTGLGIVYIGAESGSDMVLRLVNKGESADQIITAIRKIEAAEIGASVTFISGLGSKEHMKEHAVKTGEMISALGASYVGLLTLMLDPLAPIFCAVETGEFEQLTPYDVLDELEIILENININKDDDNTKKTVFRSNHASNWLILKGTLPDDRENMLDKVRLAKIESGLLREEWHRRL